MEDTTLINKGRNFIKNGKIMDSREEFKKNGHLGLPQRADRGISPWFIKEEVKYQNPQKITLKFNRHLPTEIAKEKFNRLMELLNRRILKQAYRRHGIKLKHKSVIEGNDSVKRHIHTTIELPEKVWKLKFKSSIENIWVYQLNEKGIHFGNDNEQNNYYPLYKLKKATKDLTKHRLTEHIIY